MNTTANTTHTLAADNSAASRNTEADASTLRRSLTIATIGLTLGMIAGATVQYLTGAVAIAFMVMLAAFAIVAIFSFRAIPTAKVSAPSLRTPYVAGMVALFVVFIVWVNISTVVTGQGHQIPIAIWFSAAVLAAGAGYAGALSIGRR